jgi:xylulokinase
MLAVHLLGIDLGTQGCKVVIVDAALEVRGVGRAPIATAYPAPGHAEQDPRGWMSALERAIGQARAAAGAQVARDVAAIGVTGQLDGAVAIDRDGAPLGPALIWMDRRAALPPLPPDFFVRTGQVADATHLAAKARWLAARQAPACVHVPVSFVVEQLCGARVLDVAHASTTMLCRLGDARWDADLLGAFGLSAAMLPAIAAAHDRAGGLRADVAARLGLPAGIAVAVGTGDDFATPLGAGLTDAGQAFAVLGTAEVVGALSASPALDPQRLVETHPYPAGGYLIENPGWLSGGALRWLAGVLGLPAGVPDDDRDVALDELAGAVASADGVAFLPALSGAMTPAWHAGARGAFYGLTPAHDRRHLARAVYEGLAFAARDVLDAIAALGVPLGEVTLLGGGARSHVAPGLRARATGRTHVIPAELDTAALGAAALAAVTAGAAASVAEAARRLRRARVTVPAVPDAGLAHGHRRHRALAAALSPLFDSW